MTHQSINAETSDFEWKSLYKVGGVTALLAGVFFRRNIAAEIGLFSQQAAPVEVSDWFALLQSNRLLGLVYLNIFDLVNYTLLGLMFLALYAALRQTNKSGMAIAVTLSLVGITIYFASNTAFSMLSLSDQYAAAGTEAQRTSLVAAGQALLAINRFSSPGGHPGAAGYMSLLLLAMAGMIDRLNGHAAERCIQSGDGLRGNPGNCARSCLLHCLCFCTSNRQRRISHLLHTCRRTFPDVVAHPGWLETLPTRASPGKHPCQATIR